MGITQRLGPGPAPSHSLWSLNERPRSFHSIQYDIYITIMLNLWSILQIVILHNRSLFGDLASASSWLKSVKFITNNSHSIFSYLTQWLMIKDNGSVTPLWSNAAIFHKQDPGSAASPYHLPLFISPPSARRMTDIAYFYISPLVWCRPSIDIHAPLR